jgi:hypothetical protein
MPMPGVIASRPPPRRATFIVRFWREAGAPPGEWRAEVEQVDPAGRVRLAATEAVFAHLRAALAEMEWAEDTDR